MAVWPDNWTGVCRVMYSECVMLDGSVARQLDGSV